MTKKVALITGITGQDGSYLAEFLLEKGYIVHGIIRRSSSFNTGRIDHIFDKLILHHGDLLDSGSINRILQSIRPDEIYNLAAMSHVKVSFEEPEYTANVTGVSVLKILESIRSCNLINHTKFYQASTSELFGNVNQFPQTEDTPFYPRSPYGIAKQFAHWTVINYRESYNMYCCSGILFNHESPRRGSTFVTKKITEHIANKICNKSTAILKLGNIDAKRDWGHANDYVHAMWLMLQQPIECLNDYVISIGEQHSVREFCELAYRYINIEIEWIGDTINEIGVNKNNHNEILIKIDPKYYRPAEVDSLLGYSKKAKEKLGWKPKTKFYELVYEMLEADIKSIDKNYIMETFDDLIKKYELNNEFQCDLWK